MLFERPSSLSAVPEIIALFKQLNDQGTTIAQVTHSESNAAYGSRIIPADMPRARAGGLVR